MLIKSSCPPRRQDNMFKKISILLFFLMAFFISFSLQAQEKTKISETQFLYSIKFAKDQTENKDYRIFVNNNEWFKKWINDEDQMAIEINQKDGFIKPSYVKKVKKNNI